MTASAGSQVQWNMANLSIEQTVAIIAIQQLVHGWAQELDVRDGRSVADLVTDDCTYEVGGEIRRGRAEVAKFYADRIARLSATPEGLPIQRHAISNLRAVTFDGDEVSITFCLLYFTTAGMSSGTDHADPAAVADVRMSCRRGEDGSWKISKFDSNQTFRRGPR